MPSLRFQLQKQNDAPGSSVRRAPVFVALLFFSSISLLREIWPSLQSGLLFGVALFTVLIGVAVLWYRGRLRPAPWIDVYPDRLVFCSSESRQVSFPFRTLIDLAIVGHGTNAHLHVGALDRRIVVPLNAFARPEEATALIEEVSARVEAFVADGRERVELFKKRATGLEVMPRAGIPATESIIALLVVVYALQDLLGVFNDPYGFGLFAMGANASMLVRDGEIYRLMTGNLLHGNLLHLLFNGLAIWNLGAVMERLLGPARLLVIFMLSAIGGAVASAVWAPTGVSVGASTAAFGLLGAFLVLHLRGQVPRSVRQTHLWWGVILLLNGVALPLLFFGVNALSDGGFPHIDVAAHCGGFVVGMFATFAVTPPRSPLPVFGRAPSWLRGLSALLVVLVVVSVSQAAFEYPRVLKQRLALAARILAQPDLVPVQQNMYAWLFATDPESTRSQLDLALRSAKEAVAASTDGIAQDMIRDTVATLEFRLGHTDQAIEREVGILQRRSDPQTASQLARFLDARVRRSGPIEHPELGLGAALTLKASVDADDGEVRLQGRLESPTMLASSVYVLAKQKGSIVGLLRLPLEPGAGGDLPSKVLGAAPFSINVEYVPALFVAGSLARAYWTMDQDIAKLPGDAVPSAGRGPS